MNLNKAMLIGNLTRDPELRSTPSGNQVATFALATNLVYKNQGGEKVTKVEYHNIVVWRKLAEICGKYLKKGSKVYIEGRIETRNWEKDGAKHYRTEIVADQLIMLSGKTEPKENEVYTEPEVTAEQDEVKVENIPF